VLMREGMRYRSADTLPPAMRSFDRSASLYHALMRDRPGDPGDREGLARVYNSVAILYRVGGRPAEAVDFCRRSIDHWDGLLKERPSSPAFKAGLARALNSLGVAEDAAGRGGRGVPDLERSRGPNEGPAPAHPPRPTYPR